MNKKHLLTLIIIVALAGSIGLLVHLHQSRSWQTTGAYIGKPLFKNFPYNDVGKITISDGTNTVHLQRVNNQWIVPERYGYPANFSEISSLLLKLADLKAVQVEEVDPSQRWRFGLLKPNESTNAAVEVVFETDTGKHIATIWLGKMHMRRGPSGSDFESSWPDGRYILPDTNGNFVALVSETFTQIEPKPDRWINKDFFKVNKPKRIQVRFPDPTNSWCLVRENENSDWKLEEAKPNEKLDTSKAHGYNYVLSWPSFNDVLPGTTDLASLGLTNPIVITIETFENFTYTIKVGSKTNEAFPVQVLVSANLPTERPPGKDEKPEDKEKLDKEFQENLKKLKEKLRQEQALSNWIYLVPTWTIDTVLRERHMLLASEAEDKHKESESEAPTEPEEETSSNTSIQLQTTNTQTAQSTPASTSTTPTTPKVITSDIIKVPSAEELKKGAKIEIIKADEIDKYISAQTNNQATVSQSTNSTPAP